MLITEAAMRGAAKYVPAKCEHRPDTSSAIMGHALKPEIALTDEVGAVLTRGAVPDSMLHLTLCLQLLHHVHGV